MAHITLHGVPLSGHSHRAELFLNLLGLAYDYQEADATVRATPEFRDLNPLGQVPVLRDGDLVLADSNAILVYLAKRYDAGGQWLPETPAEAAAVQRWLSIAAGEVRNGPAWARVMALFGAPGDMAGCHAVAGRLLAFMDRHLDGRAWLAARHATIADIACYSYVAHAPEGGVDLSPYPRVQAWIARVEALPRFKAMPRSPVPA
jgi:glutathione S-transferase